MGLDFSRTKLARRLSRRGLGLEEGCEGVLSLGRGGLRRVFLVDGSSHVFHAEQLAGGIWRLRGLLFGLLTRRRLRLLRGRALALRPRFFL